MSFFTSTELPPECRLNSKKWHEVTVTTVPSKFRAWLGDKPVTRVFIRKDPFSQWYVLGDASKIITVPIERMNWLDTVWEQYGDQNDWLEDCEEDCEADPDGA